MNNVIDFPKFKTEQDLYPQELKDVLKELPQDIRDEIREAMETPINKYKSMLLEDINISIPSNTSEEQRMAIQQVIANQRQGILELVQMVALSQVRSVLDKHKNS